MSAEPGSTDPLEIEVNGEPRRLTGVCSVAQLLGDLGLGDKRVAVAVNREVVRRARYPEVALAAGDRVEILEAVGGG